jgi:NAD+ diphosphatase
MGCVFEPLVSLPDDHTDETPVHWFYVRGNDLLVTAEGELAFLDDLPVADEAHVLGRRQDGTVCCAAEVPADLEAPNGHRFAPLRGLYAPLGDELWNVAGRAVQIVDWHRTHRFCAAAGRQRSGHRTSEPCAALWMG